MCRRRFFVGIQQTLKDDGENPIENFNESGNMRKKAIGVSENRRFNSQILI